MGIPRAQNFSLHGEPSTCIKRETKRYYKSLLFGGKCNWKLDWEGRKLQLMPYRIPPGIVRDRLRQPAASPRDICGMSLQNLSKRSCTKNAKKCKISKMQKCKKKCKNATCTPPPCITRGCFKKKNCQRPLRGVPKNIW